MAVCPVLNTGHKIGQRGYDTQYVQFGHSGNNAD